MNEIKDRLKDIREIIEILEERVEFTNVEAYLLNTADEMVEKIIDLMGIENDE